MTAKKGQKPAAIRNANIKLVMQLIDSGVRSRCDLAKSTKLSNPALTMIIDQMLGIGFVKEGEKIVTNERGRRKVDLAINREFAAVVGVDFSSDNILITLADFTRKALAHREIADSEIITRKVLSRVVEVLREVLSATDIPVKCICVGVPGKVNAATGRVHMASYKYRDCCDIDMAEFFESEFGIPTVLANDASLQMLAEKTYEGAGRDSALIYNDYGMGGALWLKGENFEGDSGFAAELGAIPIAYDGEVSIFEDICGINAMLRASGYDLGDPRSFDKFLAAYAAGGKDEGAAVERSARGIALLIRCILGVAGCRDIMITGKASRLGGRYIDSISKYLKEEKIFDISQLSLRYGHFRGNATVTGAVEKAVSYVIDTEIARR